MNDTSKASKSNAKSLAQYSSYLDLASNKALTPYNVQDTIDAIVVPAGRPAQAIADAAQLAQETGTPLIVLCSKQAIGGDVADKLASYKQLVWHVIDIPPNYNHPLLELTASSIISPHSLTASDVAKKRNIGLMLGKSLGGRLLFLDDDIRLQASGLRKAARMLAHYPVVGFRAHPDTFPDISVGMHAIRTFKHLKLPGSQDWTLPAPQYYLSGGSLVLNLRNISAHFPERIYDEDWLFLYEATIQRRVSTVQETYMQKSYDPFASPERAAQEEFGNIISGGLYDHLKSPSSVPLTDTLYWEEKIAARKQKLEVLHEISHAHSRSVQLSDRSQELLQQMDNIKEALAAAMEINQSIDAEQCAAYYSAWHEVDVPRWNKRFNDIPADVGMKHMLQMLDLQTHAISSEDYARRFKSRANCPRNNVQNIQ